MNKLLIISLLIIVLFPSATLAAAPRTSTQYKITSGKGGVDVFPYLSGDKKTMVLDFQSPNLSTVEYIKYNLNYSTTGPASLGGVEGTIVPDRKSFQYYSSIPYQRFNLTLGSCSKNVCVYSQNPSDFKITVNTKYKNNKTVYTKVFSIY